MYYYLPEAKTRTCLLCQITTLTMSHAPFLPVTPAEAGFVHADNQLGH